MTGLKNVRNSWETIKTVLGDGGSGSFSQGKRQVDEGQGSQKGQKKRRVKMPFEGAEKVKDIEMGDLSCELCNMNFQTTKVCKAMWQNFIWEMCSTSVKVVEKGLCQREVLKDTNHSICLNYRKYHALILTVMLHLESPKV